MRELLRARALVEEAALLDGCKVSRWQRSLAAKGRRYTFKFSLDETLG